MNVPALVDDLHRRGVKLRAAGDRLRWRAPTGVMSHADVAVLRTHKETILSFLRPAPDHWTPDDWQEFFDVLAGNGPCNKQRLAKRNQAQENGEWVREAACVYAEKQAARAAA